MALLLADAICVRFHDGQIDWILLRDKPAVGLAWLFTGIVCWIAAYIIGRRARRLQSRTVDR